MYGIHNYNPDQIQIFFSLCKNVLIFSYPSNYLGLETSKGCDVTFLLFIMKC